MSTESRIKKTLIIFLCIVLIPTLTLSVFAIGEDVAIGFERFVPDYDRVDIVPVLEKSELSNEDYKLLYYQTGLSKSGLNDTLAERGIDGVLEFQDGVFGEYKVNDYKFAPFCHYYSINKKMPIVPVQNGDIIVSSSTEFSFWSVGHCAMVVDAENGVVVEAIGIGSESKYGTLSSILRRGNFIILRPTVEPKVLNKIIDYTTSNLIGIKYDPTIGILSRKYVEDIKYTHCAHIFWYAFYKHGIDIDSNGGPVVTPKDISHSEHFKLIQVSGFDHATLWD